MSNENVQNIILNLSAGLQPKDLSIDEIKELANAYGPNWFEALGYNESIAEKPTFFYIGRKDIVTLDQFIEGLKKFKDDNKLTGNEIVLVYADHYENLVTPEIIVETVDDMKSLSTKRRAIFDSYYGNPYITCVVIQ